MGSADGIAPQGIIESSKRGDIVYHLARITSN
jgi:hypothetical protein